MDRQNEKGMALIATIWVIVLLAVVAASFARSVRVGLAGTRNFKEDMVSYYQAVAAVEDGVRFLLDDTDRSVDYMDADGRLIVETEGEPFTEDREGENVTVRVRISDESARINLNVASADTIRSLLVQSGLEDKDASEIVDAVMDWKDPDEEHRPDGAETEDYEEDGYIAKDGLFSTVDELLMVKGMNRDILNGNPEMELTGISSHLSVCGQQGMNANTVSAETMEILGVPSTDIDAVLQARGEGPITSIPSGLQHVGINATSSNCFRIRAEARPTGTQYTRTVEAVVLRIPKDQGFDLRVIRWRDDVS